MGCSSRILFQKKLRQVILSQKVVVVCCFKGGKEKHTHKCRIIYEVGLRHLEILGHGLSRHSMPTIVDVCMRSWGAVQGDSLDDSFSMARAYLCLGGVSVRKKEGGGRKLSWSKVTLFC